MMHRAALQFTVGFILMISPVVCQAGGGNKEFSAPSATKGTRPDANQMAVENLLRHAGDIFDLARAGRWDKAEKRLVDLRKAENSLRLIMNEENSFYLQRLGKKVEDLGRAVAVRNRKDAMHYANRITLIDVALMGQFKLRVPTDVMVLDYCGRELEILAEEKDFEKMSGLVLRMHLVWQNLMPQLIDKGATREIKKFSEIMKRLEVAKTPEEFGQSSRQVLDEVDNLEKVFMK